MKKDLAVIGGLLLLVVVLLIFGNGFTSSSFLGRRSATSSAQSSQSAQTSHTSTNVLIGTLKVNADLALTPAQQQKGLSKRESMPISGGMLFVFDKPSNYIFWMKDMKFAIDIIWIDENKKVIYIEKNVKPEPGRNDNELTKYQPPDPKAAAKYVLEINAGLVDFNNIHTGDTANFQL